MWRLALEKSDYQQRTEKWDSLWSKPVGDTESRDFFFFSIWQRQENVPENIHQKIIETERFTREAKIFLIEIQLIYNVVLVLGVQQRDSVLYTHTQVIHLYTCICCHLVSKSCLTLCDPMDCNLPGPSVHGVSQARILEWVTISFSNA